jgi:predicted MFS family arabinose efflux permease
VNNANPLAATDARSRSGIYSRAYLGYVLFILVMVQTLSFVDRQLLTILVEPIKAEFGVSDTAMGLLTGMAFALFYVTLSIPLARLADRRSRRNMLAAAIGLWSLATALCGAAANFIQLAIARVCVGVGEAGGGPPALSLIPDYFPPRLRSTALGIFTAGSHLGVLFSMVGGAVIATHFGWRTAFFALGLPGVLVALLIWRTVDEPLRGRWDAPMAAAPDLGIFAAIRRFWIDTPIRLCALAAALTSLSGFGFSTWLPSFAMRVHGLSLVDTGLILGVTAVLGGSVGSICGGMITDAMARRDPRWQLQVSALALLVSLPLQLLITLWPAQQVLQWGAFRLPIAFCFMPFSAFFSSFWLGPVYAAVHNLVRPGERAQVSACLLLLINILGAGTGPLLVGVASDLLAPVLGAQAIRYALLGTLLSVVAGSVLFWRAGALYRRILIARGSQQP